MTDSHLRTSASRATRGEAMTICPKCHSSKIIGPKFQPVNGFERECLSYTCFQCGYVSTSPTLDQLKAKPLSKEKGSS